MRPLTESPRYRCHGSALPALGLPFWLILVALLVCASFAFPRYRTSGLPTQVLFALGGLAGFLSAPNILAHVIQALNSSGDFLGLWSMAAIAVGASLGGEAGLKLRQLLSIRKVE